MFLCRSMCFVLSGWLSFAMRLLQRSIVTAVALLAFPVSVSDARVVCCSPSRLRIRYAVCCPGLSTHPTHGTHTHLTHHTDYTHTTHSPHTSYTPYTTSTPHHIHSSHTFIHHPSPILAHTQIWDGMLFVTYLGCTPVLDQVQQIYPMLYILPKLN